MSSELTLDVITIIVITICLIISSIILFDYIRTIGSYQWERKPLKWLGGGCLISFTISLLLTLVSHIIYSINHEQKTLFIVLYELKVIFWVIAECTTYFIFIVRIYYTFEQTAFQASSKMFKILIAAIVLFIISQIQFIFLIGMYYTKIMSYDAFIIARNVQIVFNDLVDLFISIMLFYLFISRLHAISQQISSNAKINHHRDTINGKKQRDNNTTILFNITAKLTVLATGPLIITQLNFIFEVVLAILNETTSYTSSTTSNITDVTFSPIMVYIYLFDVMCSIWCSYMTYTIENAKILYSRPCKSCDTKCKSIAKQHSLRPKRTNTTMGSYFELTDTEDIINSPSPQFAPIQM